MLHVSYVSLLCMHTSYASLSIPTKMGVGVEHTETKKVSIAHLEIQSTSSLLFLATQGRFHIPIYYTIFLPMKTGAGEKQWFEIK